MTEELKPLRLIQTDPEKYSLLLETGTTPVDDKIQELRHEPNGYFWEGIAQLLLQTEAQELGGRFDFDPEAGMFCAYSSDSDALRRLGALLATAANDEQRIADLVQHAAEIGFEFD